MDYDCIVLVAGHSDAGIKKKKLKTLLQTTIASTPGVCNAGSEKHFIRLLKPYEHTDLILDEDEVRERFQPIKKIMNLDVSTPIARERVIRFLEDPGFISRQLSKQYREKMYHFDQEGFIKIIAKGTKIMDITELLLSAKRERECTKTDVFDFLEGANLTRVLFIDMSCQLTEDLKLIDAIRKDKILGGKTRKRRMDELCDGSTELFKIEKTHTHSNLYRSR
jgi:hypothetical protein